MSNLVEPSDESSLATSWLHEGCLENGLTELSQHTEPWELKNKWLFQTIKFVVFW